MDSLRRVAAPRPDATRHGDRLMSSTGGGTAASEGETVATAPLIPTSFLAPTGLTREMPPSGPVGRADEDPEAEASFTPSDRPPPTRP